MTAMISSLLTIAGISMLFNLDINGAVNIGRLLTAKMIIEKQYVKEVDGDKLIGGAISGMVHALGDPHSVYLEPKIYKQLKADTSGMFGGIGVYMNFKDKGVEILSVIKGSAGEKAGLKVGDKIMEINGEKVGEIETGEVALKIRGEIGTNVELLIRRDGEDDKIYNIKREIVKVQTVRWKKLNEKIGYIRITNFSESTGKEFKSALEILEKENMEGLILDLRQNPGGVITSCVEIAREIVPKGPIVSVIERDGTKETYSSELETEKYPIVVLLDQNSASASELLAGALQDTKAAVVVGTKSYGKGTVQTVIPMFREDGLKLTIAKYYTPSGRSIDGTGIIPDYEVKLEEPLSSEMEIGEKKDEQLMKAEEILEEKIK